MLSSLARRPLLRNPNVGRAVRYSSVAPTPQATQKLMSNVQPSDDSVPQAEIVWSYSSEKYVEQERARVKKPTFVRTLPITLAGRFDPKPSTIILPQGIQRATEKDLKHHSSNKHFIEVLEKVGESTPTKGLPVPKPLEVPAARPSPWVAALMPVQYARSLTVCTETVRRLGTDWVGDVKNVLELGSDGAGLLAWRSIAKAVEDGDFDRSKDGSLRGKEEEEARTKKAKTYEEQRYEEDVEEDDALEKAEAAVRAEDPALIEIRDSPLQEELAAVKEIEHADQFVPEEVVEGSVEGLEGEEAAAEIVEEEPEEPYTPSELDTYEVKFEGSLITKSPVSAHQIRTHIPSTKILDKVPEEASPKKFDLIIAHDLCVPHKDDSVRLRQKIQRLHQLLTPSGVLVLIGEGSSRGFLAMNMARDIQIVKRKPLQPFDSAATETADESATTTPEADEAAAAPKPLARVIAPCTNQEKCPLADSRLSRKRNNCLFTTRYQYPAYIQRILPPHNSRFNYEDSAFSYLVTTPYTSTHDPSLHKFPRIVDRPLKRAKHITLDVCTSAGKVERWVVPKSFGKHEYHDARKTRWGDIWPLGAKTKRPRNMKFKKSMKDKKKTDAEEEELAFLVEGEAENRAMNKVLGEMEETKDVLL